MTSHVLFLHFSVGTSGAQAVPGDYLVEKYPGAVPESGNGKMCGKKVMLRLQ